MSQAPPVRIPPPTRAEITETWKRLQHAKAWRDPLNPRRYRYSGPAKPR